MTNPGMIAWVEVMDGGRTGHRCGVLVEMLTQPVPTSEGDAAAQALADRLGCSKPEAYRRAVALVARLLEEVTTT